MDGELVVGWGTIDSPPRPREREIGNRPRA